MKLNKINYRHKNFDIFSKEDKNNIDEEEIIPIYPNSSNKINKIKIFSALNTDNLNLTNNFNYKPMPILTNIFDILKEDSNLIFNQNKPILDFGSKSSRQKHEYFFKTDFNEKHKDKAKDIKNISKILPLDKRYYKKHLLNKGNISKDVINKDFFNRQNNNKLHKTFYLRENYKNKLNDKQINIIEILKSEIYKYYVNHFYSITDFFNNWVNFNTNKFLNLQYNYITEEKFYNYINHKLNINIDSDKAKQIFNKLLSENNTNIKSKHLNIDDFIKIFFDGKNLNGNKNLYANEIKIRKEIDKMSSGEKYNYLLALVNMEKIKLINKAKEFNFHFNRNNDYNYDKETFINLINFILPKNNQKLFTNEINMIFNKFNNENSQKINLNFLIEYISRNINKIEIEKFNENIKSNNKSFIKNILPPYIKPKKIIDKKFYSEEKNKVSREKINRKKDNTEKKIYNCKNKSIKKEKNRRSSFTLFTDTKNTNYSSINQRKNIDIIEFL